MSRSTSIRRFLAAISCGTFLASTAVAQTQLYDLTGDVTNDRLGSSVANAGDVDGDGMNDIFVGAPEDGNLLGARNGFARLYSGATGAVLNTVHGDFDGDLLGWDVDAGGDVDGDGVPDLIAGAPFHTHIFQADGMFRVYSGATGLELFTIYGTKGFQQMGRQVVILGDLNGDGRAEVMASSETDTNDAGIVRVYSFNGVQATMLYEFFGVAGGARLGLSATGVGDVNADGVDDMLVGSAFDGYYVYSGADGSQLRHSVMAGENTFGSSVASIGDVSGDGVDDMLIGANQKTIFSPGPGRVYVVNGATGSTLLTVDGATSGDAFSTRMASIGDYNSDGVDDFMATSAPNNSEYFVTIHSGSNGNLLTTITPDVPTDKLGLGLAALGDINGDMKIDFAIGAPNFSDLFLKDGLVRVYSSPFDACGGTSTYCAALVNSTGAVATIESFGDVSASAGNLILRASNLPANKPGLFYYGTTQVATPVGDGLRCVGGTTRRLDVTFSNGSGVATNLDLFTDPGVLITSAGTWNFQYWYRDVPGGPAGFNFSQALRVNFCD